MSDLTQKFQHLAHAVAPYTGRLAMLQERSFGSASYIVLLNAAFTDFVS